MGQTGGMAEVGVTFQQETTREVYRNPWMRVREDTFRRPDGSRGLYAVIERNDFALVVPYDRDGFHLVEQFRYPVGERCWEFPQGGWPAGSAGGEPVDLARAELAEETGYRAVTWTPLGRLQTAPGAMSQRFAAFLATDLTPGAHAREEAEQDMRQQWVPRAEFERMVRDGEVRDANSIAAYALFRLHEHAG